MDFSQNQTAANIGRMPREAGFSLIELMMVIAIMSILLTMAIPFYQGVVSSAEVRSSVADLETMSRVIDAYIGQHGHAPETLKEVGIEGFVDPWGRPYEYQRLMGPLDSPEVVAANVRLSEDGIRINTDYDLFTIGADGEFVANVSAPVSQDDVIRGDNGSYTGLAEHYGK